MTGWEPGDRIARVVLGTADDDAALRAISVLCERHLGSAVNRRVFHAASVGSVHGVLLEDGRRVVVKLHRAVVPAASLAVVNEIQHHLARAGFPAPRPLAPPVDLGSGRVTFEDFLDVGEPPDPERPRHRTEMAVGLARLVMLCRPFADREDLRSWPDRRPGVLWPQPHDLRFDFEATAEGAEWIDDLGRRALATLDRTVGAKVVGHNDWRREHLRLDAGRLSAVYDWDSVGRFSEPVLVAGAVRTFTADWSRHGHRQYPTLEEMTAFLAAYEEARGAPFSGDERARLWAAVVYGAAYTARCEHSDDRTDYGRGPLRPAPSRPSEASMRAFLAEFGPRLLREPPRPRL